MPGSRLPIKLRLGPLMIDIFMIQNYRKQIQLSPANEINKIRIATFRKIHRKDNGCHAGRAWIQGDTEQKMRAGLSA